MTATTADERSNELFQTLHQIAGDRSLSAEDRALAADMLELLPDLQTLRQRGFGELIAQYRGAKLVHVDCKLQRQVEQRGK